MSAAPASPDTFKCLKTLKVGAKTYEYFSLPDAEKNGLAGISRLPISLKVLIENLLRHEDGRIVKADDIRAVVEWLKDKTSTREIAYRPARVLMQDFTGVPAVVDLAAMRDAMKGLGGDPSKINPLVPVDLVIDHSVQVDFFGSADAFKKNVEIEYERNKERYEFLRWGAGAFNNFRVVPPGTGICHQVNLEYLAQSVWTKPAGRLEQAFPDTCVGTDSHTTMVNALGVLGWGVGGIEAEAAMLGQPVAMVIPEVIGFGFKGKLKEGVTATDLVLTCTQMLRKRGVVEKFVEYYGDGLDHLSVEDRATIGNMAPEYGATCGFFPVDADTIKYLKATGRAPERVALVEAYCKAQGLWREAGMRPVFTDMLELDLSTVEPSLAGPKRPQDRVPLSGVKAGFAAGLSDIVKGADLKRRVQGGGRRLRSGQRRRGDRRHHLLHQHVEPLRADRRRPAGAQRAQEGPEVQAVGEDLAGAGLAGRHRLPRQGRPAGRPRRAGLQPGRLRLHHLHRQFRAAARQHRRRRAQERPGGRRGALGQPQLRGPRQRRREGQLPGLAAAGGGLCAGRHAQQGPDHRAAGHGQRRAARLSQGHLADLGRDRRAGPHLRHARHVRQALRPRVRGRREVAGHGQGQAQPHLPLELGLHLRAEPALFRGARGQAQRRSRT